MLFCSLSKHFKATSLKSATGRCLVTALITIGFVSLAFGQTNQVQTQNSNGTTRRAMTAEELAAWQAHQKRSAQQANTAQVRSPQLPPGFPLPADEQQYVEKVLDYWQQTSDRVSQYKCDFLRYEYDTSKVNLRDPQTNQLYASQQAAGEIRFAAPDKARFETTRVFRFMAPPEVNGGDAKYEPLEGHTIWGRNVHECWVCTGDAVYDFDFDLKARYKSTIPPELKGNVAESPLPFLFGAKKQDVMNRYWVRYIEKYETDARQKLITNEIWLEIYPKRIQDGQTYSKVELILSADDFMPLAIHMYAPNYNPAKNNFSSNYFLFQNRKINGRLNIVQDWFNRFVEPTVPATWRKVDRQSAPAQSAQRPAKRRQ